MEMTSQSSEQYEKKRVFYQAPNFPYRLELNRAPGAPVFKVVNTNEYLPEQYDRFIRIPALPSGLPQSNPIIDFGSCPLQTTGESNRNSENYHDDFLLRSEHVCETFADPNISDNDGLIPGSTPYPDDEDIYTVHASSSANSHYTCVQRDIEVRINLNGSSYTTFLKEDEWHFVEGTYSRPESDTVETIDDWDEEHSSSETRRDKPVYVSLSDFVTVLFEYTDDENEWPDNVVDELLEGTDHEIQCTGVQGKNLDDVPDSTSDEHEDTGKEDRDTDWDTYEGSDFTFDDRDDSDDESEDEDTEEKYDHMGDVAEDTDEDTDEEHRDTDSGSYEESDDSSEEHRDTEWDTYGESDDTDDGRETSSDEDRDDEDTDESSSE